MKFCWILFLFFINISVISSTSAEEQSTRLTYDLGIGGGWVPYHSGANENQPGIFEELTKLVAAHSDITFSTVYLPPKRAQSALLNELVDFDFTCIEWFNDGQYDTDKFVVSDPIFNITEYFVTLAGNRHLYDSPEKANGKVIGTIAGYFYHNDQHFTRMDFLSESQIILGLRHERFEAIILEQETAKYWSSVMGVKIDFAAKHSSGQLRFRLLKQHKTLVPQINQAIKAMKQNGSLANIFKQRGIDAVIIPVSGG